jgi:AAA+ ATPase superfamily predicted ATPase
MPYSFPASDPFINRSEDLAALRRWWDESDPNALNLYGRRRVGKSWLFLRFADGKPATILVAERLAQGSQLARLSVTLEHELGFLPQIQDVPALFRLLYQLGKDARRLVVLDEFPYLLPRSEAARDELLTAIQAVMEEERDNSQTKRVIGECKWTSNQVSVSLLAALENYKLPALRADKLRIASDVETIIFSRSGFTDGLIEAAAANPNLTLVRPDQMLAEI